MNEQPNQFITPSIEQPHDVLELPSKGLYYPTKKGAVKIAFLNASDENILTSMNLMENGEMLDVLMDRKVLDRDLRPAQMLDGDRMAILFFLRATGYGSIFPIKLTDPITKKQFDYDVDLTKIPLKENLLIPNEMGECEFMLPTVQKNVKFRFLSGGELKQLMKEDDDRQAKLGKNSYSTLLTSKLAAQIQEVDGVRNRGEISMYVEQMSVKDSAALRKYIADHEPGLDLKIEVTAPSGARFQPSITITAEFFWPYL
jgi:hypothetical protein